MVGLVTRNSQIARIGDLWFFIWHDSCLTEPSWLGRLHCRQVSVQVRAVRVGLVWSIRANQQHSKNLPGFFSQTSDHLSVASVSYGFSDFSFSPWEKTQKEWRCTNTNPKKKKKTVKKDISLNQTVLSVKPSLVIGLHKFQSSSSFCLRVVTST